MFKQGFTTWANCYRWMTSWMTWVTSSNFTTLSISLMLTTPTLHLSTQKHSPATQPVPPFLAAWLTIELGWTITTWKGGEDRNISNQPSSPCMPSILLNNIDQNETLFPKSSQDGTKAVIHFSKRCGEFQPWNSFILSSLDLSPNIFFLFLFSSFVLLKNINNHDETAASNWLSW